MIYLKLVGCALIICSALCAVQYNNRRLSRKKETIEALLEFVRYARGQVECFMLPASSIIERCDVALLQRCGFKNADVAQSFAQLLDAWEIEDGQTQKLMSGFLCEFGRSYRDEQLRQCDHYIEALRQRGAQVSAELPQKKKLCATLCISGALGVLIIFI